MLNTAGRVQLPSALVASIPMLAPTGSPVGIVRDPNLYRPSHRPMVPTSSSRVPVQRELNQAVRRAEISKPATCRTFHHSFATHLFEDGHHTVPSRSCWAIETPARRGSTPTSSTSGPRSPKLRRLSAGPVPLARDVVKQIDDRWISPVYVTRLERRRTAR